MADSGGITVYDLSKVVEEKGGFIESANFTITSDVAEVKDKEGKVKAKAYYGHKREGSVTFISKGGSYKINDVIKFGDKNFYITSVEEVGSNSDFVKYNIKATHYGKDTAVAPKVVGGGGGGDGGS